MSEMEQLNERLTRLENILSMVLSDRVMFSKHIQMQDGANIQLARGTGTKIGTDTDQKIGFYGVTPVDQPDTLANIASGGGDNDGTARTRCDDIVAILQELGLMA